MEFLWNGFGATALVLFGVNGCAYWNRLPADHTSVKFDSPKWTQRSSGSRLSFDRMERIIGLNPLKTEI